MACSNGYGENRHVHIAGLTPFGTPYPFRGSRPFNWYGVPGFSLFFLLAVLVLAVPSAAAEEGKTVIIDTDVTGYVVGNGDPSITIGPTLPPNYFSPDNNTVIVNSGVTVDGYVYGGLADSGGSATGNEVTISGTVSGDVSGGDAYSDGGPATATGNTVSVSGTVSDDIYGGYAESINSSAAATGNEVSVSGTVSGDVSGGFAYSISGGSATATGNTVTIGGTMHGDVYGGSSAPATYNTVTINDGAAFTSGHAIYGGGIAGGDVFTGNKLGKNSAAVVYTARNFEFIEFGYSGDANINSLDTTPTGSSQSGVTMNTNANNVNFTGVITGSGSLTKTGAGTLTLSGANTYSGGTTVSAGTLAPGAGGSLRTSSLSLGANTVFDYSTATAYASSSPGAFQAVTVNGLGASIKAGAGGTADFSGGTLNFIIPATAVADSVLLNVDGAAKVDGAMGKLDTPDGRPQMSIGDKLILIAATGGVDGAPAAAVQTAGGDTYRVQVNGDELQAVLEALSPTSPVVPAAPGSPRSPGKLGDMAECH